MAKRVKGKADVVVVWDLEIPEDAQIRTAGKIRKMAKEAIEEVLMTEALATKVFIESLELNVVEEG